MATANFLQQFGQFSPASLSSAVGFLVNSLLELERQQDANQASQVLALSSDGRGILSHLSSCADGAAGSTLQKR
ncbi:hypothetical protein [Edwardsiella hoshinae]|uniref:hypothetical protein n=1 Tax=Edwardsiella hoshinae TaxID=93378 RepID=UPI00157660D8|nr:hypothetical protein [Edwardsiella hoshinae]